MRNEEENRGKRKAFVKECSRLSRAEKNRDMNLNDLNERMNQTHISKVK